jgi:hypothetical protein
MAQITLRGMDPEMEQAIRKKARKSGKSLNRVILDIICENTSYGKSRKISPADSLRTLAGGWSEKDASEFFESIKSSQQIDEEMWR